MIPMMKRFQIFTGAILDFGSISQPCQQLLIPPPNQILIFLSHSNIKKSEIRTYFCLYPKKYQLLPIIIMKYNGTTSRKHAYTLQSFLFILRIYFLLESDTVVLSRALLSA
jgi:hypothetical protein